MIIKNNLNSFKFINDLFRLKLKLLQNDIFNVSKLLKSFEK